MTQTDLLQLKRDVRRDDSLTDNARLLFAEIADLHLMDEGCFAYDTTLAGWIGTSQRTVERRRKELKDAGYLREEKSGGERHLIPQRPSRSYDDSRDDTGDVSADDMGASDDTGDGEAPDTRDVHREINIPADAGESAPAREGSPDEDLDIHLVKVWRSVSSAPPLTEKREKVLFGWAEDGSVTDPELFREVLQEQAADTTAKGSGLSMGILLREYRKQRDAGRLEPWQQEDDRYSVDEQGRICFKGHPVEDLGPQNLAADLESEPSKDGARGTEPEVSAND